MGYPSDDVFEEARSNRAPPASRKALPPARGVKTFYIASSSRKENIASVRALAGALETMGMRWTCDWTIPIEGDPNPAKAVNPQEAENDIEGARAADLFVTLLTPEISRGAYVELGVRLGVKKAVHVVLRGQEPFFFHHHPLAKLHKNAGAFVTWLTA